MRSAARPVRLAETRPVWLALHRYLGLATMVFLGLAAITGCLLCFAQPLDAALNPDLFRRARDAAPIAPLAAAAAVEAAHPDWQVVSVPLRPERGETLLLQVARRGAGPPLAFDEVFVDSNAGRLAGVRSAKPGWSRAQAVRGLHFFHYTLLAGTWGRWLMALCAGGWLVGNLIGVYLTWPKRRPILANWAKHWRVRPGTSAPRFLRDLHRASGLWLLIGVTALAATSVALNLYDEAFNPAVHVLSPPLPSPFDGPAKASTKPAIGFSRALEAGAAAARRQGLDWRPAAVSYFPDRTIYGVTFTRSGAVSYRGLGPAFEYVSADDGRFVAVDNPYRDSAGAKATRGLYPIHTGQVAGPLGVAVVLLLGLATLEMCVTGAYVWWKRRPPRVAARLAARTERRRG